MLSIERGKLGSGRQWGRVDGASGPRRIEELTHGPGLRSQMLVAWLAGDWGNWGVEFKSFRPIGSLKIRCNVIRKKSLKHEFLQTELLRDQLHRSTSADKNHADLGYSYRRRILDAALHFAKNAFGGFSRCFPNSCPLVMKLWPYV